MKLYVTYLYATVCLDAMTTKYFFVAEKYLLQLKTFLEKMKMNECHQIVAVIGLYCILGKNVPLHTQNTDTDVVEICMKSAAVGSSDPRA